MGYFFFKIEIFIRTVFVLMALRMVSIRTLIKHVQDRKRASDRVLSSWQSSEVMRIAAGLVRRLSRRPECLTASMVLFWMDGDSATLHFGWKKKKEFSDEAHAWVGRSNGEKLSTESLDGYVDICIFDQHQMRCEGESGIVS